MLNQDNYNVIIILKKLTGAKWDKCVFNDATTLLEDTLLLEIFKSQFIYEMIRLRGNEWVLMFNDGFNIHLAHTCDRRLACGWEVQPHMILCLLPTPKVSSKIVCLPKLFSEVICFTTLVLWDNLFYQNCSLWKSVSPKVPSEIICSTKIVLWDNLLYQNCSLR